MFAIVWEVVIHMILSKDLQLTSWVGVGGHLGSQQIVELSKGRRGSMVGVLCPVRRKKIKHKVRSPHRQVALPVESPDTLDFSRIGRRRKDFEYGNCNTMLKSLFGIRKAGSLACPH